MDRRRFLSLSAFYTVAAASGTLSACHSGDDNGGNAGNPAPPPSTTFAFPHGVASGDPRDVSAVFWTRCVANPDGSTASQSAVSVTLQVSTLQDFSQLVASVPLSAVPDYDFTVRAKVTGLTATTTYYYRFVAGSAVSAIGTTRTAPPATEAVPQVRFAWLACQNWSTNHWQALSAIAAETDLDFIVHLGCYIYETGFAAPPGTVESTHQTITLPGGDPYANTLDDYRALYRIYRGDTRLQTLHARFPVIATWGDHEFSDDCWKDHQTYTNANLQQTARRRAANQAWAEYLPVDWGDVSFDLNNPAYDNIRLYRDFHFGSLVHLVMTDERLYRDDHVINQAAYAQTVQGDPVNGNNLIGTRYFVDQQTLAQFEALDTQALGRVPSILGTTQTQWWKDKLQSSTSAWKVWGNEVMMNRLWAALYDVVGGPGVTTVVLDADAWDGYPSHKSDLMTFLKTQGITNVVSITGDLRAFQAGIVRDVPGGYPITGTPVMIDLVTAGISSQSFYDDVVTYSQQLRIAPYVSSPASFDSFCVTQNPDLLHADHDAIGYASATVTPTQFVAVFNKVYFLNPDGTVPVPPVGNRTRLTINAGTVAITVEDNV